MGPLIAAGALAGFQIWSGMQQAQMIRRNAELQSQIDEMNAGYAELDAYNAEIAGESEIAAYQSNIDQVIGEQRVAFAAQDVDVSFGTAAELQRETKSTGLLNQIKMRQAARERASGFRKEASNIRLGSSMGRQQAGINAWGSEMSGYASAASTALTAYARNK